MSAVVLFFPVFKALDASLPLKPTTSFLQENVTSINQSTKLASLTR
jgi:hypothetical protein